MKTIDIKGTPYVTVNSRLTYFRENYKDFRLVSEIISNEGDVCIIKASVINEKGDVVATGHAFEKANSTFINKTSHIENCETSAWGRCLGNLGIGIDAAVASYEEVANAVKQQETPKKKVPKDSACADKETIKKEDLEDLIFKDIETIKDLIELHIALTKAQQDDKDIKAWFNIRQQQFKDEKKNG